MFVCVCVFRFQYLRRFIHRKCKREKEVQKMNALATTATSTKKPLTLAHRQELHEKCATT